MTDPGRLSGKTTIITGASAGIGAATARALARGGATLALAARREDRLEKLADELAATPGQAVPIPTDITEEAAVEALVDRTRERFGSIDIVINNAGIGLGADVETLDTEDYRQMMEVNVDGVFYLTRASLPDLRQSRGNLIFVGSFAGQYPRPFNPVYAATKWWVRGFAKSVMAEVGGDGVGVTIVNPSEVRTEFGHQDGDAFEDRFEPGTVTEPEEIAAAIRFAAEQDRSTVAELDLFRRDKFETFD